MVEGSRRDTGLADADVVTRDEDVSVGGVVLGLAVAGAPRQLKIEVLPVVAASRPPEHHDRPLTQAAAVGSDNGQRSRQLLATCNVHIDLDSQVYLQCHLVLLRRIAARSVAEVDSTHPRARWTRQIAQ